MKNSFEFPAKIENISKVESIIDNICSEYDLGCEKYGKICMAVIAAAENGIIHGNKLDSEKYLNLSYKINDREIGFVVSDQGAGFNYKIVPDPTNIKMKLVKKGRGIYVMKLLSDEIKFRGRGNEVELKFRL